MEIILVYLGTIIMGFVFELDNTFTMYKDVADAGYKIDNDRMKEFANRMNPKQNNNSLLRLLIPIYNIIKPMMIRLQYNQQKFALLDQLDVMDCLEEMTETEKVEYAKKPTGLNAILIPLKTKIELSKALKFEFKEEGTIWFIFDEKQKDIKIVKAEGPISKLPLAEQKQKLKEEYMEIFGKIIEQFGTIENFSKEVVSTPKDKEGKILIDITPKSTTEKIAELKDLRDELTFTIDYEEAKRRGVDDAVLIKESANETEEKGYQKAKRKDK